ncbi:GH25 family lysozyme [Arthrobacter sp.]|uniref:GH25 family lysozyme n=1 Tax=Arthrobacter sp. TaxID=1667 RepID=UPI003395ADA2
MATDRSSAAYRTAMAEATKAGGAEMGQGTRAAGAAAAGDNRATTEALAPEGTWMPGFGVQGLDVSKYQAGINWQTQWNLGARFAYVKATEGNYYTSTTFGDQYLGARSVGMIRGAYHFANPAASSGADQARIFVQSGGGWSGDGYTLPPVLDFEDNPYAGQVINNFYQGNKCYDMTPGELANWARDFGNTVKALTGRIPVMYTNAPFWNLCAGGASGFGDWPLWIASWPGQPTNGPTALPSGWGTYSFWQYSDKGPFADGGDSNVWNGSYAELSAFAANGLPPAAARAIAGVASASASVLGAQTSGVICGLRAGGCFQGFQNGAVMWSPATGAQPSLVGPIRDAWARSGFENGAMGYPTSGIICGLKDGGCFQNYQGGAVMWSPGTGAALSPIGVLRDFWAQQRFENGTLGYPTSDPYCGLKGGGCFQNYQGGTVVWSPATGAQTVTPGPVQQVWQRTGFENGTLGYPTGQQQCDATATRCTQTFQGGTAAWSSTGGGWAIPGNSSASWRPTETGYPIAAQICGLRSGGCFQNFEQGVMMYAPASGAFSLTGAVLKEWQASGFENGSLGYPTSAQTCLLKNGGCFQNFEKASVLTSPATGTHPVYVGPLLSTWGKVGFENGLLGYPVQHQVCGIKNGGCFQSFEGGAILWSPATGAHVSAAGPIRNLWQSTGFENGALGYPTGEVTCGIRDGGCYQIYEGGAAIWKASSGAQPSLTGPIRSAWQQSGYENGPLGYPTSAQFCGLRNGGCFQNFEGGSVLWSSSTGAQLMTSASVNSAWAKTGFENGNLGYPTSAVICGLKNSGCFQNFEKGSILWSPASGANPLMIGPIQAAWAKQGYENGPLGYPTSTQNCILNNTNCTQTFQGGTITWTPTGGATTIPNKP